MFFIISFIVPIIFCIFVVKFVLLPYAILIIILVGFIGKVMLRGVGSEGLALIPLILGYWIGVLFTLGIIIGKYLFGKISPVVRG